MEHNYVGASSGIHPSIYLSVDSSVYLSIHLSMHVSGGPEAILDWGANIPGGSLFFRGRGLMSKIFRGDQGRTQKFFPGGGQDA